MEKAILNKAQVEQNLAEPMTESYEKFELSKELLTELRSNTCIGKDEEDVVSHIAKILEILDLVKIANMDPFQLRMKVFPLSLFGDARKWWMNEGNGKITTWEELVKKFFLEDHEYGNPPNTNTDSSTKPDLDDHHERDGNNREKWKGNTNEWRKAPHPTKVSDTGRICKTEKFEVIKYSLGPNEDYISIKNRGYNTLDKSKDSPSHIYQEIFRKQGEGWTVKRMNDE
ncbi:hypothetical protein Tco_0735070 [Tanacetum coccineum]